VADWAEIGQRAKIRFVRINAFNSKENFMRTFMATFAAAVLIIALFWANHYVPFQFPVLAVYLGFGLAGVGILSIIRPIKAFRINSRKRGCLFFAAGILIFTLGMEWPAPTILSGRPHQRIDDFVPAYQFYEYHEVTVHAPQDVLSKAMREVSLADIPVAVWLLRIRAMASGGMEIPQSILTKPIIGNLFVTLDGSDPYEYVGGMVMTPGVSGPPPAVFTPGEFLSFTSPGNVKVAFNMKVVDLGNGMCRLSSETRVAGTDKGAQKKFAKYWRVIYPGSAIIRRVWLNAIIAKASDK